MSRCWKPSLNRNHLCSQLWPKIIPGHCGSYVISKRPFPRGFLWGSTVAVSTLDGEPHVGGGKVRWLAVSMQLSLDSTKSKLSHMHNHAHIDTWHSQMHTLHKCRTYTHTHTHKFYIYAYTHIQYMFLLIFSWDQLFRYHDCWLLYHASWDFFCPKNSGPPRLTRTRVSGHVTVVPICYVFHLCSHSAVVPRSVNYRDLTHSKYFLTLIRHCHDTDMILLEWTTNRHNICKILQCQPPANVVRRRPSTFSWIFVDVGDAHLWCTQYDGMAGFSSKTLRFHRFIGGYPPGSTTL